MARAGTRATRIKNADLYAGLMSDMPTDSFESSLEPSGVSGFERGMSASSLASGFSTASLDLHRTSSFFVSKTTLHDPTRRCCLRFNSRRHENDFQQQLWKSSRVGHVALMLLACLFALFVFIRQYHQCGLCPRSLIMLGTNVLPSMVACAWLFLGPQHKVSRWATNVDVFVVFVMAMGVESLTLVCEDRVNGLCSVFVSNFIPPLEVVVPILIPHLYVNALQAGWVFVLVYGGVLSVYTLLVWNLAVSVNAGMKLSACSFLCVNVAVAVCAAVASERRLRTQYVLLCSVRGELAAKEAAFREREQLLKEKNLLRDANIRAETSRKVHERTIGYCCHQLQHPIHSIKGCLDCIFDRIAASATTMTTSDAEDLRAIWQSVLHMQQITEDVLDHTKLRVGKLAVRRSDVSIRELLQTVITDKDRDQVAFETYISDSVPDTVWTDRLRMQQILRNAMSNAVKFSRGHDPICVYVKRVGGSNSIVPALRIEIRNKGFGLQVDNPAQLFDVYKLDDEGAVSGIRLGLPICRMVAELLGGTVGLYDEGAETVFWFEMSLVPQPANRHTEEERRMQYSALQQLRRTQPELAEQMQRLQSRAVTTDPAASGAPGAAGGGVGGGVGGGGGGDGDGGAGYGAGAGAGAGADVAGQSGAHPRPLRPLGTLQRSTSRDGTARQPPHVVVGVAPGVGSGSAAAVRASPASPVRSPNSAASDSDTSGAHVELSRVITRAPPGATGGNGNIPGGAKRGTDLRQAVLEHSARAAHLRAQREAQGTRAPPAASDAAGVVGSDARPTGALGRGAPPNDSPAAAPSTVASGDAGAGPGVGAGTDAVGAGTDAGVGTGTDAGVGTGTDAGVGTGTKTGAAAFAPGRVDGDAAPLPTVTDPRLGRVGDLLEESALPSVSSDDDPLRHVNPTAMMLGADRGAESPTEFSLQVRNRSVSAPGEGGSPSIMDAQLAMSIRRYRGAIMPFVPPWSLNVVLVDGEALHRRLGGRMLRKLGCSFVLCEAVHDVRRAIRESDRPFDFVLTDINLARGRDGRQLCAQLRDDGYVNPIIACTAETSESNRQSYVNAGFTSLLAKPYGLRDLQLMLHKHNPRPHEVSIARRDQLQQQGVHQPQQQRQGPRGAVPAHQGHAAGRLQRRQLQEQRAMIARQRALERQQR